MMNDGLGTRIRVTPNTTCQHSQFCEVFIVAEQQIKERIKALKVLWSEHHIRKLKQSREISAKGLGCYLMTLLASE